MDENVRMAEVAPVFLSVDAAGKALGVGRSAVWELVRKGELRSVKIGARRLVSIAAIAEYAQHLEATS